MGSATRYRKKFLTDHSICAFCGGKAQATTIEHCPPRAMFQHRQWPVGFEFPSCAMCNHGTDDQDLLISVFAKMNPFVETVDMDGTLPGQMRMVNKQYPGMFQRMMPSASAAKRINREMGLSPRHGQTHQETGVVKVPDELHGAVCVLAKKLSKGIFYRETGQVFPNDGCLLLNWFTNADLVRDGKYVVFDLLKEMAGEVPPTVRSGKHLGEQFEYKFSLAAEKNVFVLQSRFGGSFGMAVFGSSVPGLLEGIVTRLREQSSRSGPFAVLQSSSLM